MNTLTFLAEWALRSSILILSGWLLLGALRVRNPSARLAAWAGLLSGSMAMPMFVAEAPRIPVVTMSSVQDVAVRISPATPDTFTSEPRVVARLDWVRAGLVVYAGVALGLLLRLGVGLAMSRRLLRASLATGAEAEGVEIRESDRLGAPVTLGLLRPVIILPTGWREWSDEKRDAVLAHERSHIRRLDPAVQLLSAVHRALLWHSPMSWVLHSRIVRVAEEASDDAAVARIGDRTLYAEVLLGFMRLGVQGTGAAGVPMARYGRMESRINRILEGSGASRALTRWGVAAILALASPLTYLVAAAHVAEQAAAPAPQRAAPAPVGKPAYTPGLGTVAGSQTVVIKPRVDGLLKSLGFRDGQLVQQGQSIASLDAGPLDGRLLQAEAHLEQDRKLLSLTKNQVQGGTAPATLLPPLEGKVSDDEAEVGSIKLRVDYAEIKSPITGVAGFRMVDIGNTVHAGEPLVVITQMQPAVVVFTVPEDAVAQVRRSLTSGGAPVVEAWNRDNTVKIASGHLTAIDNQIDVQTGTAKLKAVFDNKDSALFPGQFVNARLVLSGR